MESLSVASGAWVVSCMEVRRQLATIKSIQQPLTASGPSNHSDASDNTYPRAGYEFSAVQSTWATVNNFMLCYFFYVNLFVSIPLATVFTYGTNVYYVSKWNIYWIHLLRACLVISWLEMLLTAPVGAILFSLLAGDKESLMPHSFEKNKRLKI